MTSLTSEIVMGQDSITIPYIYTHTEIHISHEIFWFWLLNFVTSRVMIMTC